MTSAACYVVAGAALLSLGMAGLFFCRDVLRKVLAMNLAGSGVFLMLVAPAGSEPGRPADPVPHALVLTGIVVAVSATAVALSLFRQLSEHEHAVRPEDKVEG